MKTLIDRPNKSLLKGVCVARKSVYNECKDITYYYIVYRARLYRNGKSNFLGDFKTESEASQAYKKAKEDIKKPPRKKLL